MPVGQADVAGSRDVWRPGGELGLQLVLASAFALLALPTLILIARESWVDEQAQHGPLILAIGLWLMWRRWAMAEAAARPPVAWIGPACAMGLGGALYVLSRVAAQYIGESYGLYLIGVSLLYARFGGAGLKPLIFPLCFLLFAIPVPFAVGWPITVTLRLLISQAAAEVMKAIGVAAVSDGLTMYVGSYRIEIAQACSGMNSLLTLSALGLSYVYLRRDPGLFGYAKMAPSIVIFAVVANFARVIAVVSLTQIFGDGVAQGAAHAALGFMTFAIALVGVFGMDVFLNSHVFKRRVGAAGSA